MAEIVGVVASGIAISQLAVHILSGIKKLHGFLNDAKGAPRTIADTLQELELLGDVLNGIQINCGSDDATAAMLGKCVRYCQQAVDNAESVISGLGKGFQGQKGLRPWSALQATLRKGDLEEFQNRLNHALSRYSAWVSIATHCTLLYLLLGRR